MKTIEEKREYQRLYNQRPDVKEKQRRIRREIYESQRYDPIFIRESRQRNADCREAERRRFLQMYGGRCSCCGETGPLFLTMDHNSIECESKNKQTEMRRAVKKFDPEKYQILCYNCDMGQRQNKGVCPHKANV
jgi:hypothetical protein